MKQDIQHQSACRFKQGFMVVLLMLVYGKLLAVVQVKRGGVGLSHSQTSSGHGKTQRPMCRVKNIMTCIVNCCVY